MKSLNPPVGHPDHLVQASQCAPFQKRARGPGMPSVATATLPDTAQLMRSATTPLPCEQSASLAQRLVQATACSSRSYRATQLYIAFVEEVHHA